MDDAATATTTAALTRTAIAPAHTHTLMATIQEGNQEMPEGAILAAYPAGTTPTTYNTGNPTSVMSPHAIGTAGGSQPHNNMSPFLCLNFIIALEGIFPSRD